MISLEERTVLDAARRIRARERREAKAKRPAPVIPDTPKIEAHETAGTKRGHISLRNVEGLKVRQHSRCAECSARLGTFSEAGELHFVGFHVDHVIPLALGGSDNLGNWQILCVPCHAAKTKIDVARIAKAKRQAKMMQPKEPSKHFRKFVPRSSGEMEP